ncbi:D-alanyl-D-alanine carboxypeptidase/D-alanyl-D-alanine endopeptidase [Nocardioides donggukensis]|uniref:D-alanyl-D-alanine carboxypeptidase/D-alanyl-D-alanine-endopeptidase n=1 Tax=Nocardioides donggukensis TaxID=2774019 RepID=A0A927K518_9ACTN|nr:D-alanyl-D-alanine carboxypeptidase/D-alanyl-D-alanine-endopeptidase [Nocardioides donggukensis]MBD8870882.1 D-alanyl-D-alanine carboxypeptidase/D-alanyl-D-alanine-endopeptidase [Nocardioides donggukensis]
MARGDTRHSRRRRNGRPGRLGYWLPTLLVLAILAAAFASFEYDVPGRLGWSEPPEPAAVAPPSGLDLPELAAPTPVAAAAAGAADPRRVRRALRPHLGDDDLGPHTSIAVAGPGGTVLFDNDGGPATPASTMKLLTGVAALEALGPERSFETRVDRVGRGRLVLVGGGDPSLRRRPSGSGADPAYADLATLAGETAAALLADGRGRVRLDYDDSLFSGPTASPHWPASYVGDGVVAPIVALWVNEGARADGFGFEPDPARAAAAAFVEELEAAGLEVTAEPRRVADVAGAEVAAVRSPPVRQLVERVLAVSDNEGAEVLAHHVGLAESGAGSFAGAAAGVRAVLERLGVPLKGAVIRDGSGLSRMNRLAPATLLAVLGLAESDRHPDLRGVVTGLPVAGFTGSLARRFVDVPAAGPGRVRAKTGTLSGVHGLAGVTADLDGNVLTFVLLADRVRLADTLDARAALDDMASALADCRCS